MSGSETIHAFDPHRLFVGDVPWTFLFEIVVRAGLIYLMLMVVMRFMGKQVTGQVSRSELAVIVTLGAAVGAPLNAPERGLLPALAVLVIATIFQRSVNYFAFRSRKVELATRGDVICLIQDGELSVEHLRRDAISMERLFATLREHGIVHLGQIRRGYIEADGHFSVYRMGRQRPGLSVLPERTDFATPAPGFFACASCGHIEKHETNPGKGCPRCKSEHWRAAVVAEDNAVDENPDEFSTTIPR